MFHSKDLNSKIKLKKFIDFNSLNKSFSKVNLFAMFFILVFLFQTCMSISNDLAKLGL